MRRREREKRFRKIEGSSSIADRKRKLQETIDILKSDEDRIEKQKESRRDFFRRNLESYTGLPEKEDIVPFPIPGSNRESTRYLIGGIACVGFEILLAVWILTSYEIALIPSIILGILIAGICSLIFDSIISFSLRHIKRKEEALRKVKLFLIWPVFVFFIISFVILLLARSTTGELAILLLPLFGIALWTATISVLIGADAMFSVKEIVDWSHKESVDYASLEREQSETKSFRKSLESSLKEIEDRENKTRGPSQVIASITALLLGVSILSSCSMSNAQPPEQKKEIYVTKDVEINLFIDISQSPNPTILTETVETIWKSIPDSAMKYKATKLRVFHFDIDGFNSIKKLDIDLPKMHKSDVSKDIEKWKPIHDAINDKDSKAYKEDLIKIFNGIDKTSYLPPLNLPEPPCTDINGVMSRISKLPENKSHFVVVITDGVENCNQKLSPILNSNSSCIIVWVPEKRGMKLKARGKEEYEIRLKELSRLYPWAKIVPYFEL